MAKTNKITYTNTDKTIVRILNEIGTATLAEINARYATENPEKPIAPASMTSAVKKGLITKSDEKVEVTRPTTRSVYTYRLVTADFQTRDGKALPYSDGEKSIIAALQTLEGFVTLAAIATAVGVSEIKPGSISGLISKGNVEKCAEEDKVEVPATAKGLAYTYTAAVTEVPGDGE